MNGGLDRNASLHRLQERRRPWEMVVVGGGATGVGIAMDAASRGLEVALVERFDFGSGTSSRSTKLVHGGVRYLRQGNLTLVRDALRERALLRENAPQRVHDQTFLIPCENTWQWLFYGLGLKLYDWLAIGDQFGKSRFASSKTAQAMVPGVRPERVSGAILYHDGQFDDARLLVDMARTAASKGACLANYVRAESLSKDSAGKIRGLTVRDMESADAETSDTETAGRLEIAAEVVVNAAGPFCDAVRQMDEPECEPMVAASQGVHLVLPKEFYPGKSATIVPKTSDGRVIFMVPWYDRVIVGTTDTAIPSAIAEPSPKPEEINFLLETASRYLSREPTAADVCSVFTGIRPLVKGDTSSRTASLSRDHVVRSSDSGLITITGGKWTTVRKMAEDCVDQAIAVAGLQASRCQTREMKILGEDREALESIETENPDLRERVHPSFEIRASEVVFATRYEMARTVEDVLSRRTRMLFLHAGAAVEASRFVAEVMARELGKDAAWEAAQIDSFEKTARHYRIDS